MNEVVINNRIISNNVEPYIIAELSANHNGDIQRAFDSILAAKKAGADAVKIQTYTADTITLYYLILSFKFFYFFYNVTHFFHI